MSQEPNTGGNLRSVIASTIIDKMNNAPGTLPQAAAPMQEQTGLVAKPMVVQPMPLDAALTDVMPPANPEPQSEVSTDSVSQMDIGSMFKTATTDAPVSPPPLPPDDQVQAPPEIEQNDKAKSAWEILRNRERESRHRAEALQAQLENISKQAGAVAEERAKFAAELQARDDRIHELEDNLGKVDLASKPEFRHQYDDKMEAVSESFSNALYDAAQIDDEQVLASTVKKLLTVNDSEFNRLVSELPATAQGSLWDKRREYRNISAARENAIAEWRTTQAGVVKADEQRQVVVHAQRRRDLAEQAIDFTNTKIEPQHRPSILSESTYKQDVDSANQQFRGFMQVANDDEIARVAYQGFLMPVVQRQVAFLADAVNKWRDAYYAIRGAGAPPALPIRVQSEHRASVPITPSEPKVVDRGGTFSGVIQDTLANTIRRAYGQ